MRYNADKHSCLKFVCVSLILHRVPATPLIFILKYVSRASQLMDNFEEMEAMVQDESDVKALK